MQTTWTPERTDTDRRPRGRSRPAGHRIWRAVLGTAAFLAAVTAPGLAADPATAGQLAFPYHNDFSSAAGGTTSGDAAVTGGVLRLTEDVEGQAGAWSTDDTFPSSAGLDISFRYDTGRVDGQSADGLVLSLSDGAAQQGVGQYGAGLGYSCRNTTNQGSGTCDGPGLPGAFAAVGLDQYGNFSLPFNGSGPGRTPGSVVVRGSGNGTSGYRYVAGRQLPGGVDTGGGWRDVRVLVRPEPSGVLRMTVQVSDGTALRTVLDRVELGGAGQTPLPPTMRLGFAGSTGSVTSLHRVDSLVVRQPVDVGVTQALPEATAGEEWSYTVHVENSGVNASDPSAVHVAVPDQLEGASWTCSATGGASCGADSGDGDVDTTVGLPPGSSADFVITGTLPPSASGQLESVATIDVPDHLVDSHQEDNASTETTPVRAAAPQDAVLWTDKSVATVDGAEDVVPGDDVEYTVTAHNDGPAVARAARVEDDLPAELTFAGSRDGCTADGQHVTCGGSEDLEAGGAASYRFRATIDPEYDGDGSDVLNVAIAQSPSDPDGGRPSPEVPLPPIRPVGPGDPGETPEPTTRPTERPDGGHDGGGQGSDRGPDAGRAPAASGGSGAGRGPGALAFTGSRSVGLLGGLAAGTALVGVLLVRAARRRAAQDDSGTTSDVPLD